MSVLRDDQPLTYSVEVEAIPARSHRQVLRLEVEALLPENAQQIAKVAESERDYLVTMAAMYDKGRYGPR